MAERRKRASGIAGQSDNELVPCYVATTEFIIADCGSLYENLRPANGAGMFNGPLVASASCISSTRT
jgi:hypothetical protein